MIKYKLAHTSKNPLDYETQETKAEINQKSTHDWLYGETVNRLKDKDCTIFKEDFRALKADRIAADYKDRSFTQEESVECSATALRLLGKLNNIK